MATIKEFTNYTGQETIYPVTVAQAVYVDNTKTLSQKLNELTPSTTTPQNVATTGQVGQAVKYARGDHVHGIQLATGDNNGQVKIAGTNVQVKGLGSNAYTSTEFAPLASPALTGTPTAPTAAVNTNTTQIATTAFVNNQIDELQIGGRNLLKNSHKAVSNGDYATADYYFGDRPPLNGEIVTLQVKGALAETKTKWTPYNSGGSVQSTQLELSSANYNSTTGIYTATGRWAVGNAANTFMRLYAMFNNQSGTSQIEWVKLERGTKATDWTPAPEDLEVDINLTANRAAMSDSDGNLTTSKVTSTELEYLSGVKSGVQTQLDGKSPTTGSTSLTTVASNVSYGDSGFQVVTSKVAGGTAREVGWYRIAEISDYTSGTIYCRGGYYSGWPTNAVCSFQTSHTVASIVQLAGTPKSIFNKYRLVRDTSTGKYYIDAYQEFAYTASQTMSPQFFTIVGSAASAITPLNPNEPTDDTTNATAECTIVDISGGYLPLKGGTLSGVLTAKANQYTDSYSGALNMANSNIYGVNSIYTADASDNAAEGIHFYRDATHVDTLWMNGGDLLFTPNRALGTSTSKADSQKVGRFTANPTTGQVVITDGTTGGMKSSGYTIATSVPSGAKFTDTTYTFDTGDNNGQIKVTPLGGQAQNVQVKGLAALAYKESLSASEITNGITGVKGNAESTYRTGNVNLTSANIGAVNITSGFGQNLSAYSTTNDNSLSGTIVKYSSGNATGKPPGTDHAILQMAYSDAWKTQLAQDWRTNKAYIRSCNDGTWCDWAEITTLDYTPVNRAGDTMIGNLIVPKTRIANTYYGVSFGRTTGTPKETLFHTGIKWKNGSHMPVIHITGYAYGLASPVEFKIGFYIYGDNIGWCGAVNMGSWNPEIYLFKHTVNNVDYVSVAFIGQCYFLQLSADVQDEMGKFGNIDVTDSLWSWEFLTTTGNVPAADGGTTCISVPYRADILNPAKVNNHTVESNVPSNAKFTDTWNANSKTVDGYVTKGQGNSNMFWGTDDEGNPGWRVQTLDVSSATGILPVAHGGTGVSSFTSGKVLVGAANGSIGYKDIVSISTAGSISGSDDLVSANALSLWDGSSGSGNSNIKYTQLGELKSGAIKTSTQDLTISTDGYVLDARAGKTLKDQIDGLTKADIGLSEVDNKSSETIRSEITRKNVVDALGFTPPEQDTTYNAGRGISIANGNVINNDGVLSIEEGEIDGAVQVNSAGSVSPVKVHGLKALAYKASLTAADVGALPLHGKADAAEIADKAQRLDKEVNFNIAGVTKTFNGANDVTITKAEMAFKYSDILPIASGAYYGLTATEDTQNGATYYFASVKPADFNEVWKVAYKVYVTVQGQNNYSGVSDVSIWGVRSTVIAYKIFNSHLDTNYRTYSYHSVYRATETGSVDFGHVLGIGLRSSKFPTDANYSRTVKVEITEAQNCEVSTFLSALLYAAIPGTGAQNYSGITELNGFTNGLQETSDEDLYDRVRLTGAINCGASDIVAGNIIVTDDSGYRHLVAGGAFDISKPILYAGSDISAGGTGNNNYVTCMVNTGSVAMVPYTPVYIKGTLSGTMFTPTVQDGDIYYTQTVPTTEDGFIYILIGFAQSTNSFFLLPEHPTYAYTHGVFSQCSCFALSTQKLSNHWGRSIDTLDKTIGDGGTQYFIASSSLGEGRPNIGTDYYDAHILHMSWDATTGWDTQIASLHSTQNGRLLVRGQTNGTWGDWNAVYDTGHKPSKTDVGLGNVDNTSDVNKPISTATQNALDLKANDNAVVKLTGAQTITGRKQFSVQQELRLGYNVHTTYPTPGTAGYARVFTIQITGIYVNSPIRFAFARRNDSSQTWIDIRYASANSTDPALNGIYARGPYRNVWITKRATSTWDVYIQKSEAYDRIDIMEFYLPVQDRDKMTVTWQSDQAASVPAGLVGYTQASWWMPVYDTLNDNVGWRNIEMSAGNDVSTGLAHLNHSKYLRTYVNTKTDSVGGRGILALGNATASSDAAGARGELWIYSDATNYSVVRAADGSSTTSYLPAVGGTLISSANASTTQTINGTLVLAKTTDAAGTANNSPALIIGGAATAAHIEIDNNEILAKANGTTRATLYLNEAGSAVEIPGSLHLTSTTDAQGTSNTDPALSIGNRAGAHLEFDTDEIMAKSNGTTPSALYLNWNGGEVRCGGVARAKGVAGGTEGQLHPIAWGTAAATTSNCPNGFVYFRYS